MQAFIPAHPWCIQSTAMSAEKLRYFLDSGKTLYLDDSEVYSLYHVAIRGL